MPKTGPPTQFVPPQSERKVKPHFQSFSLFLHYLVHSKTVSSSHDSPVCPETGIEIDLLESGQYEIRAPMLEIRNS